MDGIRKLSLAGAALALALGALAASSPAAARDLDEIMKSKEIHLGYVNYPPLMIRDPKTGALSGVYVEALNASFDALKIKPVWVEQTWATFAASLQSDQIDIFVGAAFGTPQRSFALSFTQPFAFMGNGVLVRKADAQGRFKAVQSIMDLDKDGLTIVALLGSAGHDWLKAHFKHAKVVGVDATNQSQGTLEVLAGRADASYNDAFVIAGDIHAHPAETANLFETNPIDVSPISWAIKRKEPDLLVFLNTMLEYMETNGTWLQYEETYKDQLGGYYHVKRNYFSVAGETSIEK